MMEKSEIVEFLKSRNLTLGSAESYTGGGFANSITNISGASNIFKGGFVTYSNEMKEKLLGVKAETLNNYGAISPETVKEMLLGAKKTLDADIVVAFSGNAGPLPSEDKEVGLVYIGFLLNNKIIIDKLIIKATREEVKQMSIDYAINKIMDLLK